MLHNGLNTYFIYCLNDEQIDLIVYHKLIIFVPLDRLQGTLKQLNVSRPTGVQLVVGLFCGAICFVSWPCVVLFLCFSVLLALRLPRLGSVGVCVGVGWGCWSCCFSCVCSVCACLVLSVSSSS